MDKCFICETKKDHHFKDCISIGCNCACVQELHQMYTNGRQEDIKPVHPKFLKIENGKIKEISSVDKEIAKFVKIKRSEWLPRKKDKRFKRN